MKKSKFITIAVAFVSVLAPLSIAFAQLSPPTITTTSLPETQTGATVSETLAASGGVPPYTWSATNLPPGLSIDPSTGTISGVPTSPTHTFSLPAPNDYAVSLQVQDSVGQVATSNIDWAVSSNLVYTLTPAVGGITTHPAVLHVQGIYGVDICPGANPSGTYQYRMDDGISAANLLLVGSASVGQAVNDTLTFDTGHYTDVYIYCDSNVTEKFGPLTVSSLPTISTGPLLQPGIVGQAYASPALQYSLSVGIQTLTSIAAPPYTWAVTGGALPAGLSLNSSTGVISGTPTTAATSTFTIQLQDGVGQTDSKTFTLYTFAINLAITSQRYPMGSREAPILSRFQLQAVQYRTPGVLRPALCPQGFP